MKFIVSSIDQILQTEFNLPMGLADDSTIMIKRAIQQSKDGRTADGMKHEMVPAHRVQILDPATGTGTFLAEIIQQVRDKFEGMEGVWPSYVESSLIPRLHGFEILMASYTIAHLKLSMTLRATGYDRTSKDRLNVFLTNSLEEATPRTADLFAKWLSDEADEASRVKTEVPVMVMVGNPPYSGESQNKGTWIKKLMDDYKKEPGGKHALKERNPKWINDDYVKFIRLAQHFIERKGEGVIAFINPHGYLDNPTFRGMRWNLLRTFDKIYTLDLHGNANKGEVCPDGSIDENVFDIKQGVSINLFIKNGMKSSEGLAKVFHCDLFGTRKYKYDFLSCNSLATTSFSPVELNAPMYFFTPMSKVGLDDYNRGVPITSLLKINTVGIQTHHDGDLVSEEPFPQNNYRYSYRPFDVRWINYDLRQVERPRFSVMQHMLKDNVSLIVGRQCVSDWRYIFISDTLADSNLTGTAGRLGAGYVFPLYTYLGDGSRIPNIDPAIWEKLNLVVGQETTPLDIFDYIYAVLHSPKYRETYKEFLKIDFPRIPYPTDNDQYHRLVALGAELRKLHLMEGAQNWERRISFPVPGENIVEAMRYQDGKVLINDTQYFGGVSELAWNFFIGGYQPAQKWLKDRRGRKLGYKDILHYGHIIYALEETDRLMKEVDQVMFPNN